MADLLDHPFLLCAVMAVFLTLLVEAGFRSGRRLNAEEALHEQVKDARDGIILLLSLLLGFTLAMALPRYDERKHLLLDEANSIGTASLRARLLPEPFGSEIAQLLARYAGARLAYFESSDRAAETALERGQQLQNDLWALTQAASKAAPTPITAVFIQSLNEAIDMSEKQIATLENRIPESVWLMITVIAALAAFASGLAIRRRFWLSMVLMPLMVAVVMSLTADLDSPRTGSIQVGLGSMERLGTALNAQPK